MTTITLPDHRLLAYAEFGDPHGKPVFFFHGMPGSRLFRPPDEITQGMGVRLITADRPGYGSSTFQPRRRILDWPDDISQLADQLGIRNFYVAGHSGGGPYVEACAYAIPERVIGAAVLSGAGPVEAPDATHGLTFKNKLGMMVGRFTPWPLWRVLIWIFYHRRALDPAGEAQRGYPAHPSPDDELLKKPEVRQACVLSETEAFRPGLRGLAWDARLLTRPWGFALEKIHVPTHLWHGTVDDRTSPAMARFVADKIPGSRITICENEAHLLLFTHWQEILAQLISE